MLASRATLAALVAALAWVLGPVPAGAVDLRNVLTDYTFTSWSRKDGLIGPVWAIAQDANGFLWLGTDAALLRFDGVRFVSWEGLGGQPLPRLPIRALHVSPAGTLWVGFAGAGGLARIDNRSVTNYVGSEGLESMGAVTGFLEDKAGTIWVSSATGLYRLSGNRWDHLGVADGLPDDGAVNAFIDRRGALWVSTLDGLYRRTQADRGAFEQLEPSFDPQRTLSLSEDAAGRVWATDSLVGFRALGDGPALRGSDAGRGYRLIHDREDNLWVATIGQGLWRARYRASAVPALTVERTTVLSGLSSDAVRTVFEDRDGNIWAGTTDGVDRLVPHRVTPWANLGLVNTIDVATDGRVWIGTADGIIPFSRGDGGWQPSEERVPIRGAIAVRGASTGGLWVATATALYRVQGNSVVQVPTQRATRSLSIEALAADADGEAWVVTSGGDILRTDGGVLRLRDQVPELRGVRTNAALVDRRGQLWLSFGGTRIGVAGQPGQFKVFGDAGLGTAPHYDMYEDPSGAIWICGADGLSRFTGDRFEFVGHASGLPVNVYSITQDGRDDLWLATASGIIRLDPAEFDRAVKSSQYVMRFRIYDTSDGLAGYPVTLGDRNAVRASDGSLWFVTSRGVSVADPRTLGSQRLTPLVAIDEARGDDVRIEGNELKPGTSKLEISYTAPELTSPLKTRFRYRLEGFDNDWVDAGTRREALYTNLPPREYTFRVSVSQDDGRWSETEATWAFVLHPRFYQTWWFYAVVVVSLAGLLWGAWQVRVRQLRRHFSLVLGERVRLSRELHDTLLQSLVGVALEFDAVSKSLESSPATARDRVIKIREQVEEYIREARRSIWSLRSPALETGDLIDALRDTATRATAGHAIEFVFEQSGERRRLSSNIEHQLLRIGQEALFNAVRHSGAATITMRLHYQPDSITLTIADNGRGFEVARGLEGTTDHYGLTTMRERAQQAGGCLTLTSEPGRGTVVEARVPTRPEDTVGEPE
ncbi:MAG TPA: two-component regulator propeller domain-containing protein [Vicinamibacterales bacterium]|nr:two-component regulator propeller domain-containing protein [Vicinamibacterales bacterium]